MHKNTFILVLILSTAAALIVGVNVGKKLTINQQLSSQAHVSVELPPTPTQSPSTTFTNMYCGVSLTVPGSITVEETSSDSARFIQKNNTSEQILFACQKDIPKVAVPTNQIETFTIASSTAFLYHTASPKDGTLMDVVIFHHPKKNMDVLLSGIGATFSAIIRSIELVQ